MLQTTHDALVDQAIVNDAFYGALNLKDFQELYRIPAAVAPIPIAAQMDLSVAEINAELAVWKKVNTDAGKTAITDLDDTTEPPGALVKWYREAVYARAYGYLIPMLVTFYFTDQADGLEDEMGQNEGRFFARSEHFLNLVRGVAVSGEVSMEMI